MGLYLEPMTTARGFSRETFGLALALQNLFWGIGLPFAGAAADRFGASRVIVIGALVYAIGLWGTAQVETGATLYLFAGILMGLGVAFSAFSLALAAMVRAIGPERRSLILGLGTAAASAGQVVFSPISQGLIGTLGWPPALAITSMLVLAMIPLALVLPHLSGSSATTARLEAEQTLRQALAEAFAHRGFVLLSTGFFVCGFHVAFITVHFPAYVRDLGLDPVIGAWSLSLIGLFNIVGTLGAGAIGQRFSKRMALSVIYFLRAIAIVALLLSPQDTFSILLFAAVMGVLWLSTVPLTTGIIADVFGVRFMATLFGIVFLSHQIGSFLGVWLGGVLYDSTGSYDGMWWAGAVLGLAAAIIHLPIDEKPLPRLQAATG
jgi:MFS family permease